MGKNYILKAIMMFVLVGCFSSQGGCEKPNDVRFFPKETFTIDEKFSFGFMELGEDGRIKKEPYYTNDGRYGATVVTGVDKASVSDREILPIKDGMAKVRIYAKNDDDDREIDESPVFTIKNGIKNIAWTKTFENKPNYILAGGAKIFIIGERIKDDNSVDKSEYGITAFSADGKWAGFVNVTPEKYVNYFLDLSENIYLLLNNKISKYDSALVKIYEKTLNYGFLCSNGNVGMFYDDVNRKIVEMNLADFSEIRKVDYDKDYYEKFKMYGDRIVVTKYYYDTKMVELKVYDSDFKILKQKIFGEPNIINYGNCEYLEGGGNKYLIINSERDVYPGTLILTLDDNYAVSKERYISGYYINKAYVGSSNNLFVNSLEIARSCGESPIKSVFMDIKAQTEGINYIKSSSKEIMDMYAVGNDIYLSEYYMDNTRFNLIKFSLNY